jgi:hypothetical protein
LFSFMIYLTCYFYLPRLRSHPNPFVHPDCLFRLKLDGFTALARIENCGCEHYSRNGTKFSGFVACR